MPAMVLRDGFAIFAVPDLKIDLMKKWMLFLTISCGGFVACQSGSEEAATGHSGHEESNAPSTEALASADIDPVCDMVRDDSWTEFTVTGTDTVWFCAETCKEAYEANPERYQ